MSFAYWASSIAAPDGADNTGDINLGEWYDATPIFTVAEFVDMIIINNNTEDYVLARDLDFEGITPVEWTSDDARVFSGSFDGNGKSLNNIDLTDFRGVFSIIDGATITDLTLNNVNVDYTVANTTTSGIFAGRLQGTGNIIDGIQINNSSVGNISVLAGGLFGFASPLSGTGDAVISNINITNSTVTGGYVGATYGNGGLIGSVNNFNMTLENITVDVDVSSPNALNAGGVIGATLGTTVLSMDNVDVVDSTVTITGTGAALGSGGLVGYLVGTGHTFTNVSVSNTSVTSNSLSGGLVGYANQASATLSIAGASVTLSTISSSQASTTLGNGGMLGSINGYTVDISDGLVTSTVTSTGAASVGGVVGSTTNSAVLNLTNVDVIESIVSIIGTGTALGAGGFVGLLLGTGHTFTNIDFTDSSVTSTSPTGGLVGYANQASATLTINGTTVTGSTISSAVAGTTLGNGGMIGTVNGFTLNISNGLVTSNVTSTAASNVGGVVGTSTATAILNLSNIDVNLSNISISVAGGTLGAGGFVGYLLGTGHTFNDTNVIDTSITSLSSTGGVVGYANQASATLSITDSLVTGNTISSSLAGTTFGNGGILGTVNGYTITITNATVTSDVTSSGTTSAGGVVGATTASGILNLTNLDVDGSVINITATGTALGAGGVVGLLLGSGHVFSDTNVINSTITSRSSTGGLVGYANQASATLSITDSLVTGNTISSTLASTTLGNGGMIGSVNGFTITVTDATVSSIVTSTAATSIGGVVGATTATATLNLTNITIDNSTITINVAGTTLGAGGVVGKLLGSGHSFSKMRVFDSAITSRSATGGVVGFSTQTSGSATYNNIKVKGSNINIILTNATVSAGGVIGNIAGTSNTSTLNDVYIESLIHSTNANVGGVIGYTANGTITTMNRVVVYSDVVINAPTTTTTQGAAGMIGRNAATTASTTANHTFFTGYLKARMRTSQPYVGVLRAISNNLTFTNSRSAEISYYNTDAIPVVLVNTTTLYNNMRGQKATSTTYVNLRSSLNETYWNTNYATITALTLLWDYNDTTKLFELID